MRVDRSNRKLSAPLSSYDTVCARGYRLSVPLPNTIACWGDPERTIAKSFYLWSRQPPATSFVHLFLFFSLLPN